MRIARFLAGFLLGYAVVVLTTEFGFRLLPPRPIRTSDPLVMAAAALVAIVAGLCGGALATWIARTRVAGALVLLPLVAETIWLLFFRASDWHDAVGAATLLLAVAAGAYFAPKTTSPPTTV